MNRPKENKIQVNHSTYPKGPTLKGNIACRERGSERVIPQGKKAMARITNLYNRVGGSEVPVVTPQALHLINGRSDYVVSDRFKYPNERLVSNQFKHGRGLKSSRDRTWKNSGFPEARKCRGNGGLVVRRSTFFS